VLVVGGGCVGLSLAAELGWRGIPCILLEQRATTTDQPKCNLVNMRTMEHYRRLGAAMAVRAAGIPPDHPQHVVFGTRMTGHVVHRFAYASRRDALAGRGEIAFGSRQGPELPQRISQIHLEPVLRAHAATFPSVDLRFGWRSDAFTQDADGVGVDAVELGSGRRERLRGRWLVACDGASSSVRTELGIAMQGRPAVTMQYALFFRCPELRRRNALGPGVMYMLLNPELRGVLVDIEGPPSDRFVLHVPMPADTDFEAVDERELVRKAVGAEVAFETLEKHPWSGHLLVAERYREGGVFLAGDAAHLLIPTGGFGMNTGAGDAADLAWKLAATLDGWGGAGLLDSYERERRPIGLRNVAASGENAARLGRAPLPPEIERDDAVGAAIRARVGAVIAEQNRSEFESAGVQLGYRYDASPICVPDGSEAPPDDERRYVPSARPGSRAPHWVLPDGSALYDRLGRGFTLLRLGPRPPDPRPLAKAASEVGMPLALLRRAEPELRALYGADLVLVRPDQHVAWRGDALPADCDALVDVVRGAATEGRERR
jgi:2-polyprenyl-6-methoxyphenol hydroxylase-like FAD-dependent oxidoreductase